MCLTVRRRALCCTMNTKTIRPCHMRDEPIEELQKAQLSAFRSHTVYANASQETADTLLAD